MCLWHWGNCFAVQRAFPEDTLASMESKCLESVVTTETFNACVLCGEVQSVMDTRWIGSVVTVLCIKLTSLKDELKVISGREMIF